MTKNTELYQTLTENEMDDLQSSWWFTDWWLELNLAKKKKLKLEQTPDSMNGCIGIHVLVPCCGIF